MNYEVITSYDDWTIFKMHNKYFVDDGEDIKEVELIEKLEANENDKNDFVDLRCDFNGQTDDFQYYVGFNYKNPWHKVEDGLPPKRGYYLLLFDTHDINAGFLEEKHLL